MTTEIDIHSIACPGRHTVEATEKKVIGDDKVFHDHEGMIIRCNGDMIGEFDFGRRTRQDRSHEIRWVVGDTMKRHDFEQLTALLATCFVDYVLPANPTPERDDLIKRIVFVTSKFDDSEEEPMSDINRETMPPMTGVSSPGADVNVGETAAEVDETEETEDEETEPAEDA